MIIGKSIYSDNSNITLIEDLELSNKGKRFLREVGLTTIEELTQLTINQLKLKQRSHKAIGVNTYHQIVIAVQRLGLDFKGNNKYLLTRPQKKPGDVF